MTSTASVTTTVEPTTTAKRAAPMKTSGAVSYAMKPASTETAAFEGSMPEPMTKVSAVGHTAEIVEVWPGIEWPIVVCIIAVGVGVVIVGDFCVAWESVKNVDSERNLMWR